MRKFFLLLTLLAGLTACAQPADFATPAPTPTVPLPSTPPPRPPSALPPSPTASVEKATESAAQEKAAEQLFFYGDYEGARQAYQSLYETAENSQTQAAALTGIGKSAWAQGDRVSALEALRQVTESYPQAAAAASAWFYLGEIYFDLQRYAESADAYAQYQALQSGFIDDYIQERRGDAFLALGNYLSALEAYQAAQQFPAPGKRTDLEMKIAQTYGLLGDYATALAMYEDIAQRADNDLTRARINYRLGEIYLTLGQSEQALPYFQENISLYPLAYESYLSLVALLDQEAAVDPFLRGLVDYYAGQYGAALNALQQAVQTENPPEAQAYYYLGLAQRASGQYAEAIETWKRYIELFPNGERWSDAWEDIAFTQWAWLNRPDAAAQTLTQCVQQAPASPQAPGILYDAARMYERSGQLEAAARTWEQVAGNYPNSSLAVESVFQAGILYYRQNNLAAAQDAMERTLLASGAPADKARAYLWLGKIAQKEGQSEQARQIWTEGAALDPSGYYSERMRDLLLGNPPFSAPAIYNADYNLDAERRQAAAWVRLKFNLPADTDLLSPGPLADDLRFHRGLVFWQLGLYDRARSEYESLRLDLADDPANSFRLAGWLVDLGLYRSAIFAARNVLDLAGLDDFGTLSAPPYFNHIRFGLYYRALVEKEAADNGLSPLFLWSVIRQESLFEGFASSSANAYGLMQIIPSTGKNLAEQLNWPPQYSSADLHRPLVSIRFGATYLAKNRALLNNDLYAALAAYNGGPGNAAAWQSLAQNDPDLLLEVIRFDETRRYIRGIYEIFTIYRNLYSPGN